MDEFLNFQGSPGSPRAEILLATVGSASTSGVTLILDGQSAATEKKYKSLVTGQALAAGDRVLAVKISGSYVVLGKISY